MGSSSESLLAEVVSWAAATTANLYAVLDAAASPGVLEWIKRQGREHAILYNGELADALSDTGPYTVSLERSEECFDSLVSAGWADNWGFLFESGQNLEELRAHFRRFTSAELPDGDRVLFAFYDPRSLASFLNVATEAQRDGFLKPLLSVAFPVESDGGRISLQAAIREHRSTMPDAIKPLQFTVGQLAAFEADVNHRFARQISHALRRCFPWFAQNRTTESLIALASAAQQNAAKYRFTTRGDIVKFSALMLLAGEHFDQEPAISKCLKPGKSAQSERLDQLLIHLPQSLRDWRMN